MARFIFAIFALFISIAVMIQAYEDCCKDRNGCTAKCNSQHCTMSVCCPNGCTGGNQTIPACACACAGCPNAQLAASGLLGRHKFASGPAMLFEDGTAFYKLEQ